LNNLIEYANIAKNRLKFEFPYDVSDWINNMNMMMENYHKHTTWSDLIQIDSATDIIDFMKKLDSYECKCLFSGEHGYQGEWLYIYDVCKNTYDENARKKMGLKNPLQFRYSTEAYWVKDRKEKDRTNCHIVIVARTYQAMRKLNYILSMASIDGFYGKPRIDLDLLFQLTKDEVYITSACIAGWKYDDAKDIWLKIWRHFGDSFFLEYQTHNTQPQKDLNLLIYDMSQEYGIQTIIGLDTHYINEEDRIKRDNLLKRKGQHYDDENGWYMDFPSGYGAYKRMEEQCVLPKEEIIYSMMNTHVFLNGCDDITINTDFKIPILPQYQKYNYNERSKILSEILNDKFENEDDEHKTEDRNQGMLYEYGEVDGSNTVDYFLDNNALVDLAVTKYNGQLTTTSRGSASSYYTSKLLGFTTMDRFESEVPIYPERFITRDRILSSHQMPDIDFNVSSQEPFVLAAKELFGEHGCYPLLAVGKLGEKSGFKLYADIKGIEPSIANEISKCIDQYNEALKQVDDEEDKKDIHIEDYITDKTHLQIFNDSKPYQGIIEQAKVHACFLKGQLVHMSDGYKKIEDINVGDFVLTHNNKYSQVIETMKNKTDEIVDVKITGDKITCTPNHPFYSMVDNEIKWCAAEELKKGDYVGYPIDNNAIIPTFYQECKTYKNRYIDLNDKNLWWLIGRYIGDGWCESPRKNYHKIVICCNKTDEVELNEIISHIPSYLKYKVEEANTTYKINFYHKPFFEYLQQFGKYAHGKKITSDIFNLPIDYLKEFIVGYLSADGNESINKTHAVVSFKTVSKELCYGLQYCIHKVYRIPCTISMIDGHDEYIENRLVHSKKKYVGRFSVGCDKRENFYKDGLIWIKVKEVTKKSHKTETYNLSVVGDNSYTINNVAVHNCGFMLFNGNPNDKDVVGYGDIRYEIGLIRCHSESTGKSTIVANIEGGLLDSYGYVKDDFLIVDVVGIIFKLYSSINRKVPTVSELRKMVQGDELTWRMYEIGATCSLNQCEKPATTKRVMKYKPKEIKELAAFIAGIRPGFKSLLDGFLNRVEYSNGEKAIDELLKDCFHYMLYQEAVMKIFSYLGIPMKESYDTIKKISKKKLVGEKLAHVESTLKSHWQENIGNLDNFEPVYKVVKDSARYSFNAPHALAMANDSLYEAWMKAHYTSKFYEVTLNHYQDKGDKNKVASLIKEAMNVFGYSMGSYEYGKDNSKFTVDDETKVIYPNLSSVKGIGEKAVENMMDFYNIGLDDFIDIYSSIKGTNVNATVFKNLVKIGYFKKYGTIKKLLTIVEIYDSWKGSTGEGRKTISKSNISELGLDDINIYKYATDVTKSGKISDKQFTNVDWLGIVKELAFRVDNEEYGVAQLVKFQYEVLNYIDYIDNTIDWRYITVTDLDTQYSPKFKAYFISNGQSVEMKVHKKLNYKDKEIVTSFNEVPFENGDVLYIKNWKKQPKKSKINDEWVVIPDVVEKWIKDYTKIY
jgi:DNA polymerase III alpha subunit/intein/homing endonuclease